MQWGDGVLDWEIRCQSQYSLSHFGDLHTLGGGQ